MPHSIGKTIAMKCPGGRDSQCHNFMGFHSNILLALVDADFKFMCVDVGASWFSSDSKIFNHCDLREKIMGPLISLKQSPWWMMAPKLTISYWQADDSFPLRVDLPHEPLLHIKYGHN